MLRFHWPYALVTSLYCAAIFTLSAQPSLPDRAPPWLDWPGSDKVAHGIIYAGLALVVYTGLVRSNSNIDLRARALTPIVFALIYGMSDEVHQRFVPNRSFDPLDLLADVAGATILVAALEFLRRRVRRTGELRTATSDPS